MIELDNSAVISNKELKNRIQDLEKENRLLRQRLDEAGISYADIVKDNSEDPAALYNPDRTILKLSLVKKQAEKTSEDRKSTRLNSSHCRISRMPSSA